MVASPSIRKVRRSRLEAAMDALRPGREARRMAANSGWLLFEAAFVRLAGLCVAVSLARCLGPEKYGLLSVAQACQGLFTALAGGGLSVLVVRQLVQQPDREDEVLGTAAVVRLMLAVVAIATVWGVLSLPWLQRPGLKPLVLILALAWLPSAVTGSIAGKFKSRLESRRNVQAGAIPLAGVSTAKVLAALRGLPVWVYTALTTLGSLGTMILSIRLCPGGLRAVRRWRFDRRVAGTLWREGWPLILWGASTAVYNTIDQVMVGALRGNAQAGQYMAAVKLARLSFLIPTLILPSLFPYLVRLRDIQKGGYDRRLRQIYLAATWGGIICAVLMSLPAHLWIQAIYGHRYQEAAPLLSIMAWGSVLSFQGQARGMWINIEGLQRYSLLYAGSGALLNVGANLYLIPRLGGMGAAIGTLGAQCLAVLIAPLFFSPTRRSSLLLIRSFLPVAVGRRSSGGHRSERTGPPPK